MKKTGLSIWVKSSLSFLLAVVLFISSYVVSFLVFEEDLVEVYAKNISVSATDPSCYYMKKVGNGIIFRVKTTSPDGVCNYEMVDEDGNTVASELENCGNGVYNIAAPDGDYKEGGTYTLTLGENTSFTDSDLKDARKLIFTMDRPEKEAYKFAEKVVNVEKTLRIDSNEQLIIPKDTDISEGNIAFGKDEDENYVAYKIISVNGNKATVEKPAFDEIYAELDIHKDYAFDVSLLEKNPELEKEVIDNLVSDEFFSGLIGAAYGEGNKTVIPNTPKNGKTPFSAETAAFIPATSSSLSYKDLEFSVETDKEENSATFSITIPLKPGNEGVFGIEELQSQSVKLTIKDTIKCTSAVDFQSVRKWDISNMVTSDFSWSVDIELLSGEIEDDPDLDDLFKSKKFSDKHHELVKGIASKLEEFSKDHGVIQVDLFKWKVPTSVPGVFFESEIELPFSFESCADITVGNSQTITCVAGLCLYKGKFDPYFSETKSKAEPTVSLRGEATFKAGIQLEMQLCFIDDDIAYIGVTPQAGAYATLYALAPISGVSELNSDGGIYAHLETGLYLQVCVNAYINLLFSDDLYYEPVKLEYRWAIPPDGFGSKEIPFGIEPDESVALIENGSAEVPSIIFEYYDITDALRKTKVLSKKEYELTDEDGNTISVNGNKIDIPTSVRETGMTIYVKHKFNGKKEYKTQFVATTSASSIEGQVSAFNRGSYTTLENAQVTLYKDGNTPLATKATGSDGKFNFAVAPGTYTLRISAHGYKTLVTTQSVGINEVKYTEHLLLLDKTMDGMGSSSGTISDALNGRGIENVKIKIRPNWSNTEGDFYGDFSTTTNSSGRYTISDIPIGYYTVEATSDDYVTTHANILVLDDGDLVDFDFAMTPHIPVGTARIILNWGASPSDLDSHLVGRTPAGGTFNVYYSDQKYHYNGTEMANLDHDDTSSYGPETITILEDIYGTYTYAVHDFSNKGNSSSTAMSYSGARVRVLIGGRDEVQEFHIPTGRTGTYWTVFSIDSAMNIVPINTISNSKPTP